MFSTWNNICIVWKHKICVRQIQYDALTALRKLNLKCFPCEGQRVTQKPRCFLLQRDATIVPDRRNAHEEM